MSKNKNVSKSVQQTVARVSLVHMGFVLAFALATIIFDTWNLITPERIKQRWINIGLVFIVNIVVWFVARQVRGPDVMYKLLATALAIADIIFVSLQVNDERGMASKAVALYAIPIIVMVATRSRRALVAIAATAAASYIMSVTAYFADNYGEGYKVELYGTAFFYSAVIVVIAGLLWAVQKSSRD